MALGTGNISLELVRVEVGLGSTTGLVACIAASHAYGINETYGSYPITSLYEFKGYDHSISLTSKSLGDSGSTGAAACTDYSSSPTTRYLDNSNFMSSTKMYTTSAGTTKAPSGYYSDGSNWRFWTGTVYGSTDSCTA